MYKKRGIFGLEETNKKYNNYYFHFFKMKNEIEF